MDKNGEMWTEKQLIWWEHPCISSQNLDTTMTEKLDQISLLLLTKLKNMFFQYVAVETG